MNISLHPTWEKVLSHEFSKPYFRILEEFLDSEYKEHVCYPPAENIFGAFQYPFENIRVVILGQDPYHGPNQAHGLAFSVNDGIALPPSLRNIFREVNNGTGGTIPDSGNLERWAKQGVFLLNATLTVREANAGSHQRKGWEAFTDSVIKIISDQRENVVFMLWGGFAKKKGSKIDSQKHLVLESGHPSPLSANQGRWFGNSHFSLANEFLLSNNLLPIDW
ncbi:MAG TPA: uracil-DNA glycosylase [Flavobacterium sp.]|jgi:uracil-DNA glycosylase